jgi:copper oxidase (laccase) domain-containing protein
MGREFGSRPSDLVAAIGPSIGACCYQVGPDVIEAFRAAGAGEAGIGTWFRPEVGGDRFRLDVPGANRDQLIDAGLADPRIHLCGLCTFCHPALFHSYRRDGRGTGRLAGVIRAAGPEGPAATRRRG